MYINLYWAGVLTVVFVELAAFMIYSFYLIMKK